eukprot:1185973-Prorocentrum_minimum.AAC.4
MKVCLSARDGSSSPVIHQASRKHEVSQAPCLPSSKDVVYVRKDEGTLPVRAVIMRLPHGTPLFHVFALARCDNWAIDAAYSEGSGSHLVCKDCCYKIVAIRLLPSQLRGEPAASRLPLVDLNSVGTSTYLGSKSLSLQLTQLASPQSGLTTINRALGRRSLLAAEDGARPYWFCQI